MNKLQLTPTTINKDHFCNIKKLFDVSFESDPHSNIQISKIPDQLFFDCLIGTLTLSEEISAIGFASFCNCKINEIKFHPKSKLTEIGSYAFYYAKIISTLQFPRSIHNIGNYSFAYSTLPSSSITLPDSVVSIGDSTFVGCKGLKEIIVSSGNQHYKSVEGILFTKDGKKLIQYPSGRRGTSYVVPDCVTSIGNYSFSECSSLSSITLPNSVVSIGNSAFFECRSLSSITIPDSVLSIDNYAFYGCRSLPSITLPNSVVSIGNSVFCFCHSLSSITLPDGVVSIGNSAFYFCVSLLSITLPNNVVSIGYLAFHGCKLLSSITLPDSVVSIGNSAFAGCKGLKEIIVSSGNQHYKSVEGILFTKDGKKLIQYPSGRRGTSYVVPDCVTSIGNYSFSECSSLSSITLPNSVVSIGNYAFYGCSSLSSITLPDSVVFIDDFAFVACDKLKEIIVSSENQHYKSVEGILFTKDGEKLIQYPSGKKKSKNDEI